MVGTDNNPEIVVSAADNIQNIFEEYGAELWFMFIVGLLIGILLSCCFFYLRNLYSKNDSNNDKEP